MKAFVIVLAFAGGGIGVYAAYLWHLSSQLFVLPAFAKYDTPAPVGDDGRLGMSWVGGLLDFNERAGALNARAAGWTAVSVVVSAIASVVSAVFS